MMDVTHVNPAGEPIPAPTLCLSPHPKYPGVNCEWSLGHSGTTCSLVRLINRRGYRKTVVKRFEWPTPPGWAEQHQEADLVDRQREGINAT